jgi:RNA polymerase sigma-70 factor (ECF subfamily)
MRRSRHRSASSNEHSPNRPGVTDAAAAAPAARERLEPAAMADHRPRLYHAAYALCGSPHDAEDLVQDTFERVLRRPRFVRRDRGLAYMLRVLRHTWIAHAKTASRRRTFAAPPEDLAWVPDERASQELAVDARLAFAAMAELSEPLRAAVVAVDVVGLSYKQAARALRTRTGTIMSRLYRAREQVAASLDAP